MMNMDVYELSVVHRALMPQSKKVRFDRDNEAGLSYRFKMTHSVIATSDCWLKSIYQTHDFESL